MSWKSDLQLRDLDEAQAIEVLCRKCNDAYYERAADLLEADSPLPENFNPDADVETDVLTFGGGGAGVCTALGL